jgi:hypothetical protein
MIGLHNKDKTSFNLRNLLHSTPFTEKLKMELQF